MTDRSFLVLPDTNIISVRLEPVWAVLNSLQMLNNQNDFPGMHSWMDDTWAQLTPEQQTDNQLVCDFFSSLFFETTTLKDFVNFGELIDYLAEQDAVYLRDTILRTVCWLPDFKKNHYPDLQIPTPDAILSDPENLISFIRGMQEDIPHDELDLIYVAHDLLTDPERLKDKIVSHSRLMWNTFLKQEWVRSKPLLEETVDAFQRMNFDGMDRFDAAKFVTGRDLRDTAISEVIDHAQRIVFTPVPHIGPYVAAFLRKDTVFLTFRPRLPEGITATSPAMGRSELLVRLNALADDTRLQILELFIDTEELCAQDVMEILNLSQSATSRHLRQLTATGFLTERRRETAKCYSLNRVRMEDTLQALRGFLLGR